MKCIHDVELLLDKSHSCFECEKFALSNGLPIEARQVDAQAVMREMWANRGSPLPADTTDPEAPTFTRSAAGHHPEGLEALSVKLSPQVEGLALTEWWRERYGTKAARAKTHADVLAALAETDAQPVSRDINGDPLPSAGTAAELERDALAAELKAVQRAFLGVRAELSAAHGIIRALRKAMNKATALLQIETQDTAGG